MLQFFKDTPVEEIRQRFTDNDICLSFLASHKWKEGFVCRHCGHTHYCSGKKKFSRRCTRCKREESPTAGTVFNHCRIPLPEAFFLLSAALKDAKVSIYDLSLQAGISHTTCSRIKKLIRKNYERTNTPSDITTI